MTLCAASTLVASSNRVGRSQLLRRHARPNTKPRCCVHARYQVQRLGKKDGGITRIPYSIPRIVGTNIAGSDCLPGTITVTST